MLRALQAAFALPLDRLEVARLVQASERDFVGAPVGLMDPLAASFGTPGRALFIDTRSLAMEDVELPAPSKWAFCILASVTATLGAPMPSAGARRTRRPKRSGYPPSGT